jgi:hypothetical protein
MTDIPIGRYSAVPYYQQLGRVLESRFSSADIARGRRRLLDNAISHQNQLVTTRIYRSGPAVLPPDVFRLLELPTDTAGFELVRVRSVDWYSGVVQHELQPAERGSAGDRRH